MQSALVEVAVAISEKQAMYTNNDYVAGFVTVRTMTASSLITVEAGVSFAETVKFQQEIGEVLRTKSATEEHLYGHEQLFPPTQMADGVPQGDEPRMLEPGEYCFPFRVKIPEASENVPPSFQIDSDSNIRWYVQARLRAPPTLLADRGEITAVETFEFTPSLPSYPSVAGPETTKAAKVIPVFLPGFAEGRKPLSAKLLGIMPRLSKFHKTATAQLSQTIPQNVIKSGPNEPLAARLRIALSDPALEEHLFLASLECVLKQKITLSAGTQKHPWRDVRLSEAVLLKREGLHWNLRKDSNEIANALAEARVAEETLSSWSLPLINIAYELVLTVRLASEEAPTRTEKLCLTAPVHLQSPVAGAAKEGNLEKESPPDYELHHRSRRVEE